VKRASIAAICSAALIAIGFASNANAVPPLQSPAPEPTPTIWRCRCRVMPATPTPEISPAPAQLAQQKTHLLMLPLIER
jgi:hypothetical protein